MDNLCVEYFAVPPYPLEALHTRASMSLRLRFVQLVIEILYLYFDFGIKTNFDK